MQVVPLFHGRVYFSACRMSLWKIIELQKPANFTYQSLNRMQNYTKIFIIEQTKRTIVFYDCFKTFFIAMF